MTMYDDQADGERIELSLADLAKVCGGQKVDALEADFAKWVKEFYAPWASLRFVESPAPVPAAPE